MMKRTFTMCAVMALMLFAGSVFAQEETPLDQGQMPPMGPPAEMKECQQLVGEWKADAEWRMGPDAEWTKSTGKATYEMILDGGAMMMKYYDQGMMPGSDMKFEGMGIQTYDRETKQWQMTWTDNMSCRTSLYTGNRTDNGMVFQGEDKWGGMTMLGRITTSNQTADSFDWMMETSMDGGKTWFSGGKAKYTKVK